MITISDQTANINFQHKYWKLDNESFSTIRGKSYYEKYEPGEIVCISLNREKLGIAQIDLVKIERICDLSLDFLKQDGEYEGFTINSHQEFVDLLNSFYPRNRFDKARADLKSEITIIRLKWLRELDK